MILPGHLDRQVRELARFALVGGLATIVHAAIYAVLTSLTSASAQAANLGGFVSAFGVSLLGHYGYTFREQAGKRGLAASSWRLLITAVAGYSLNAGFVYFVTDILSADERFALVFMIAVTPVMIYGLSRFWVFSPAANRRNASE